MGTLESHKLNASEINESELEVDCEEHDDERCHIKVVQRPGFVCSLEAHARLPMSPVRAWEILCHPDNAEIFRHIDRCIYRKVLLNEFPILKFEVVHEATYKFLVFKGRFHTRLHVDENHETYESSFRLLPLRGLFKQFEGTWNVEKDPDGSEDHCFLRLEQSLALSVPMPPPFDRILKFITCRQVRAIFDDLLQEASRIAKGAPTLCPYDDKVAVTEIGTQDEVDCLEDELKNVTE